MSPATSLIVLPGLPEMIENKSDMVVGVYQEGEPTSSHDPKFESTKVLLVHIMPVREHSFVCCKSCMVQSGTRNGSI